MPVTFNPNIPASTVQQLLNSALVHRAHEIMNVALCACETAEDQLVLAALWIAHIKEPLLAKRTPKGETAREAACLEAWNNLTFASRANMMAGRTSAIYALNVA